MPKFSKQSLERLATCHLDIQLVMNDVIKVFDCSIIYGHRGEEEQNRLFEAGRSQLKWPKSPHNKTPSMAVDVIPYPLKDWKDLTGFRLLQEKVILISEFHGIQLFHGAWFPKLQDWPHWEIIPKRKRAKLS